MSEDPNPTEIRERLQELENDVKSLTMLLKYLVDSSPHGEQLVFNSLSRIEEQDEAVLKFDELLTELVRKKNLG
jgi:hypothetical protein